MFWQMMYVLCVSKHCCRVFSHRESGVVYRPEVFMVGEQWDREARES